MKSKIVNSACTGCFADSEQALSADEKIFIGHSMEIAEYIMHLLGQQSLRQKDLAEGMGKTEAEVSKWLTGMHNFTLRSLAKIEAAIGMQVICTPPKARPLFAYKSQDLCINKWQELRPASPPSVNYRGNSPAALTAENQAKEGQAA